jgi:hypothetical protein
MAGAAVKLAGKLSIALLVVVSVVMGAYAYLESRHELVLFEMDAQRTRWWGRSGADAIQEVWRDEGETRAMQFVETADRANPTLGFRWVWLDAPPTDVHGVELSRRRGWGRGRGSACRW